MAWFTTDWFSSHHTVRCAHKSGYVINFITVVCRISSRLKWYKNYKNRLRLAKVIVKNKMSRFFYGSLCRSVLPMGDMIDTVDRWQLTVDIWAEKMKSSMIISGGWLLAVNDHCKWCPCTVLYPLCFISCSCSLLIHTMLKISSD